MMKRLLILLLCLALPAAALAEEAPAAENDAATVTDLEEAAPFKGYVKKQGYQYVSFGSYPTDADGTVQPVLWRVLAVDDPEGTALLLTEKVIDAYPIIWVESKADREAQNFRRITCIEESDLYTWMNSTMTDTLFTEGEKAVLETSRGYVYVLNRQEMCTPAYGFPKGMYGEVPARVANATAYAKARGVYVDRTRGVSYWVSTQKSLDGYRMQIVGYNGHMSWAGYSRQNVGIRAAARVWMNKVEFVSGSGTKDDPYVVRTK